ncbi:hypothetical protein [Serratia marcescens]|uniref:hypothetical protein n=1 Tax=Serratia marcescens TaxID=615 RepID=UPI00148DF146|nr:hypothetical protein [Serratia marcescens]QJU39025.1 hypothetical protein HMI62_06665 [Serratia marcescens]
MDNKLSELSKPVAQVYYDEHDSSVMLIDWLRSDEPKNPEPLYSQEYVSALTQRIAELEEQKEGWVDIAKAVGLKHDELKAKLATPVRLPDIRSDNYHVTGWFQHMKYYRDVERSLRTAGFKVEGDE